MTRPLPYGYQEQASCLLRETDKNLLVVAPTGAGKTEAAFIGLEISGKKGVYVAPTRALCSEKADWLRVRFPEANVRVGNKDYSLTLGGFRGSDVRVLTPWKLGVIIHNDPNFGHHCPMVVLDEIQNLDPETELIITKMKLLFPGVRMVGLSATIHEDDQPKIAAWLGAAIVETDVRPVPLITRVVHFDSDLDESDEEVTKVAFSEGGKPFAESELMGFAGVEERVSAVVDHIRNSGDSSPILVYTPYRERARKLAEVLAERFGWHDSSLEEAAGSLPAEAGDFTDSLKKVIPTGVGIHHGGLTAQEREMVFSLALVGKLSVVVTCQTLAQGINLPARHVIIESVYEEPDGKSERELMNVSRFWQIAGRAGRPQFDTIGHCWIIATSEIELAEVEEILLKQKASRIESRLYNEYFLTGHVAGLIQLGWNTPAKLIEFLRASFFGSTLVETAPLVEQFERIIRRLITEQYALAMGKMVVLTDRGQRLARLGMHPDEYAVIEALVREGNTDYETWVRRLVEVSAEYVLRGKTQLDEETVANVIQFGMTAYSVKTGWAVRELVDYVSRILELTFSWLKFNHVDESFQRDYKQEVADRFLLGENELAQKLAKVLPRTAVKRVLRNCGPSFGGAKAEGAKAVVFDDPALRSIVKALWSQTGVPPNGAVGKVAGALGVTEARLRRLAENTLDPKLGGAEDGVKEVSHE